MPDRVWTTISFKTPLIFRYHLPLKYFNLYQMITFPKIKKFSTVWKENIFLVDKTFNLKRIRKIEMKFDWKLQLGSARTLQTKTKYLVFKIEGQIPNY